MTPERKTIIVSSATAIFLSVLKLTVGIMTGSIAIIASATDSVLDFFVSVTNYRVLKKSEQKQDRLYNRGYGKIQGFGALFEGIIVAISGVIIIGLAVKKIRSGQINVLSPWSISVMLVSILATTLLVLFMSKMYRKTKNIVIKADLLHYKSDLYSNLGILVALVVIKFSSWSIIDPIISLAIAGYIIYGSFGVIKEGLGMLLDKSLEEAELAQLRQILDHADRKITSYHDLKTRTSGSDIYIEVHLVFDTKILLLDAHNISDCVAARIEATFPTAKVLVHMDPFDDGGSER